MKQQSTYNSKLQINKQSILPLDNRTKNSKNTRSFEAMPKIFKINLCYTHKMYSINKL